MSSLLGDSPEVAEQAARDLADAALEAVTNEAQRWEFSSFLLCTGLPDPQGARDDPRAHAFRRMLHTLVGSALEARWHGERTVDFKLPHVRFRFEVASGQFTTGVLGQRRRVVVRGGHLIIEEAERLRRGNIRGQHAISGADITHARQGNRLHQHTTDNGGDTSRKRHSHLLYSYTVFLLLLRCLSPGRRRGEPTLCKSEQALT